MDENLLDSAKQPTLDQTNLIMGFESAKRTSDVDPLSPSPSIERQVALNEAPDAAAKGSREVQADLGARFEAQSRELEQARRQLATLQAQLVAQDRLATLGAITAGIAHEIKNPLNFIVNFAALSVDLVAEIREEVEHWEEKNTPAWRANLDESLRTLADNCAKVNQHGLRANGIVRAMQMHARGQAGQTELTDVNRLIEETLALAYHGARSTDLEFNVTIEKSLAANLPHVPMIPQEFGRVLLNLISNAFHATRAATSQGKPPTLRAETRDLGEMIQIRIGDNGLGIPENIRSRIFEPFFTTKPMGEGTGLGLSITRDIVEQMHRGTIRFESVTGKGTEFIIELPKK